MTKKKIALITRICIAALLVIALAADVIITSSMIFSNKSFIDSVMSKDGETVEVIDEMTVEGLPEYVFEAEAAEFSGVTAGCDHACVAQSYAVDPGFSGGVCLRNLSNVGNTFTFRFNSEKAVRCIMKVRVAAPGEGSTGKLSDGYIITCNEDNLYEQTYLLTVDGKNGDRYLSDYFYMHTLDVEVELKEGENTIVFSATRGANNFDCITICTSSQLTGFTPSYWDEGDESLEVTVDPVPDLDNGGTITMYDGHGTARVMNLGALSAGERSGMYTTKTENGMTTFYLGGSGIAITSLPEEEAYKNFTELRITAPPVATHYVAGDKFDPTGMEVTALFDNGEPEIITDYTYEPSGALTVEDDMITISYTIDGVTRTAEQSITVTESITPIDETDEMQVQSHIFEAETGLFTGKTYTDASASTRKSHIFDNAFSGNVALMWLASTPNGTTNTMSFTFASNKTVICNMVLRISSLGTGEEETIYGDHVTLTVNGTEVDTSSVVVPDKTTGERIYSDNFYMHDVTIPVTLREGMNTVLFTFAEDETYNMDYIDLRTSATLSHYEEHLWDLTGITVTKKPTGNSTGTISVKASATSVLAGINYTIPALGSDMYLEETDEETGVTNYYLCVGSHKIFIADNVKEGKVDLGSYIYQPNGVSDLKEQKNADITEEEKGNRYTFSGEEGGMFRILSRYDVDPTKTYTMTYTVKNFSDESISFTLYQINSQWNLTDFKEEVTLAAGETQTVELTFSGFSNENLITLFYLNGGVTNGDLGVYAYINF